MFAANADGGLTLTRVPERWPALWPEIVEVAQMADRAGLEFFLPIARWRGFGGETNSRETSFETFTFAAGLAGHTQRIGLVATVHAPMVHPVFAAKALATLDHVSGGRAALNIVCGWNPAEFALFGLQPVEDRYAQGLEWFDILRRIHADAHQGAAPFDVDGRFYRLRGVAGRPAPLQRPGPLTLNAAFSPAGRDFAARAADFLLTTCTDMDSGRAQLADIALRTVETGRAIEVLTTCHVVCRPTRDAAAAYYEHYAVAMEDAAAVDQHMRAKQDNSGSHDPATYRLHRKRFAGGAGTYPLVGTPADVADELARLAAVGFAGAALSFVNFRDELPYFLAEVLPLLVRAGLRAPARTQ